MRSRWRRLGWIAIAVLAGAELFLMTAFRGCIVDGANVIGPCTSTKVAGAMGLALLILSMVGTVVMLVTSRELDDWIHEAPDDLVWLWIGTHAEYDRVVNR